MFIIVFACELTFVCPLCFEGFQPDENLMQSLILKTAEQKIKTKERI